MTNEEGTSTEPVKALVGCVHSTSPLPASWSTMSGRLQLRAAMSDGAWSAVREGARGLAAIIARLKGVPVERFEVREGSVGEGDSLWVRCEIWADETSEVERIDRATIAGAELALHHIGAENLWRPPADLTDAASTSWHAAQEARPFFTSGGCKLIRLEVGGDEVAPPIRLGPAQPPSRDAAEKRALGVIVGYNRLKRQVFFKDLSKGGACWQLGADEEVMLPQAIQAATNYPAQVEIRYRELIKDNVVTDRELVGILPQQTLFEGTRANRRHVPGSLPADPADQQLLS